MPTQPIVGSLSANRNLAASAANTGVVDTSRTDSATVVSSTEVIHAAK
jgi:hypothetical protein